MADKKYLVAGLGNIGPEYAGTRHNIGFMILDAWSEASNILFVSERYGDVAVVRHKGREFVLLKPSTYMNLSGNAVRYWLRKLDIPQENLVVVCDDLNLPFGTVRMRQSGSDGGHNGLKNIELLLESRDYRLRARQVQPRTGGADSSDSEKGHLGHTDLGLRRCPESDDRTQQQGLKFTDCRY